MELKTRYWIGICLFGWLVAFGLGFMVVYHPKFEDVKNYILTGAWYAIITGVMGLGFQIWNIFRVENEKTEHKRLAHSNNLYPYFEELIRYAQVNKNGIFLSSPTPEQDVLSHLDKKYYPKAAESINGQGSAISDFNSIANFLISVGFFFNKNARSTNII